MSAPQSNDTQRELEQRALRNVRGLVDKMEGMDATDLSRQRRYMVGIVVGAAVFVVVLGGILWYSETHPSAKPLVIDSGKPATK
jgi:hypothetical protein